MLMREVMMKRLKRFKKVIISSALGISMAILCVVGIIKINAFDKGNLKQFEEEKNYFRTI